jgi:hypothetical protein
MKAVLVGCFVWFFTMHCKILAQNYDKNWLVGYSFNTYTDTPPNGLSLMVFEGGDYKFKRLEENRHIGLLYSFAYSCISDRDGNFLYYTNGCRILNRNCKIMLNGDTINPGIVWDGFEGIYYPSPNSTLFLPHPSISNFFYLIHKSVTFDANSTSAFYYCDKLYFSEIDSRLDGSLGGVVLKNKKILSDTLNESQMAACRHANGRDWWIPIRHGVHNLYYIMLLDPEGISIHHAQRIGLDGQGYGETYNGNAMFSPDGSKYANCTRGDKIQLFDFDRCTGYFSNPRHLVPADSMEYAVSVCFSPDSRKLYFNDIYRLWQYDLDMADVYGSGQLIAIWDTFTYAECCPTAFFQMRLAPDGRIYMSTFGSSNIYLHRIRYPDRSGTSCDFVQRDIELPNWHDGILPYFPNYRLGPVIGSVCDSIYRIKPETDIGIGPNPISDRLVIYTRTRYPFELDMNLEIYSLDGKLAGRHRLINQSNRHELDLSHLPAAVYVYHLVINGDTSLSGKLVKI